MTDDEKRLGELALRKVELWEELEATRSELKTLSKTVDLPVCIWMGDGKSVHIDKPQYSYGPPRCSVHRCAMHE